MQLFVLDRCPVNSAMYLADVHVIKMCLETAQILSSVMAIKGLPLFEGAPKAYSTRHPVISAIDTQEKLNWVLSHNFALHVEFIYRFHKQHKYFKLARNYIDTLSTIEQVAEEVSPEGLARDFKDFITTKEDIVEAHRDYYKFKKSIIKRWKYTKREEPDWLREES